MNGSLERQRLHVHHIPLIKRMAQHWQLYLFLLIPLVYLILIKYWPMLGAQIAFRDYKIKQGIWGSEWVGLKHFDKFFSSFYFERVLTNTLRLSFYSIIIGFPLPILFALQLNAMRSNRLRKVVETVTYMPHFISVVVLVGMISQIFNTRFGLFAHLFQGVMGEDSRVPNLLLSASAFPHLYVWSGIWQTLGWSTIIYTAALSSVDPTLHEAATIDGASRIQRILHVDLPAIIPTISITLILRFGSIMDIGFDKCFLLQQGSNLMTSEVISTYVYKQAFTSGSMNYSYSTAIGLFNSVVSLITLSVVNTISRWVSENSLW